MSRQIGDVVRQARAALNILQPEQMFDDDNMVDFVEAPNGTMLGIPATIEGMDGQTTPIHSRTRSDAVHTLVTRTDAAFRRRSSSNTAGRLYT